MTENKRLQGKVAVIIGDTTGIGLAAARLFVKEGAYVFITGRRQKELDEAVKEIGGNVTGVQGDVARLADLHRLYEAVKTKRRVDVIFANAGVAEFAPLGKITEGHFDRLFDINVKGTLFTVQKALPLMNDGGSILSPTLPTESDATLAKEASRLLAACVHSSASVSFRILDATSGRRCGLILRFMRLSGQTSRAEQGCKDDGVRCGSEAGGKIPANCAAAGLLDLYRTLI
jgi:NAD(P)-dependent dehydrogenase (short-subunit alcohol dehydrogenase family)